MDRMHTPFLTKAHVFSFSREGLNLLFMPLWTPRRQTVIVKVELE